MMMKGNAQDTNRLEQLQKMARSALKYRDWTHGLRDTQKGMEWILEKASIKDADIFFDNYLNSGKYDGWTYALDAYASFIGVEIANGARK